jgi:peptidyl-prolyl cis-trans isomerase SurA
MKRLVKSVGFGLALLVALTPLALSPPAHAQDLTKIAATVNDEIITVYDLIARVRLAMLASRIEDTQENRQRVAAQIMRSLIEEKLQLQEAARLGITVRAEEVNEAVGRIEQNNRWPPGQFKALLGSAQIPFSAAQDQIKASLAWGKVVRRRLRPQVDITDQEIDEAVQKFKANIGKPENRVAEIFLPVDKPGQDADVRKAAETIVQKARAGTPFQALAQQFSQSPTAISGGDMGWSQLGEMDPELEKVVVRLQPREISDPVRSLSGYHILLLIDRRTITAGRSEDAVMQVQQLVLPVAAGARANEVASQMNLAQQMSESATGCNDLPNIAKEVKGAQVSEAGKGKLNELPADIRPIVGNLRVGQASPPLRTPQGVRILMVCKRDGGSGPSRDDIGNALLQQRLEMLARKLMRDLRQQATIDIRL